MTLDLRLAVPAAGAWVAAIALIAVPGHSLAVAVAAWTASGAFIAIALHGQAARTKRSAHSLRSSAPALVSLVCAAVAICATAISLHEPQRQPRELARAITSNATVTATATTTHTARPGERSFRAELSAVQFTSPEVGTIELRGRIPVVVFGGAPETRLEIGTTIALKGTLGATEPGDDASALFFAESAPRALAEPPWFLAWAASLRSSFLSASTTLPGDGGDLIPGLAIGDTSEVTDRLDASMKTSSLSHLTAVSGANCAIVVGLIMLGGAALGVSRLARVVASVVVLLGFVVLVTPEPSVMRAAVMATLVLIALSRGSPVGGVPILSLAVLVLLIADPWLARDYGFALSVLATAGLLVLSGPLAGVLSRWVPRWLAVVIAIPVSAQLACQPVIILLDATVPSYGVIANLLAAPAAPVATVVGLLACLFLAVVPPIGIALCWLAWVPAAWIAGVAEFFATVPGARLPWLVGVPGAVLLAVVSGLVVLISVSRGRWRRPVAFGLAVASVVYLGFVGGSRASTLLFRPGDWQIAACAIGQGDAMLVRSRGSISLIDTGATPALLTACLRELGITRIDLLVLTHFDRDHVGGTEAILGMVDTVIAGPGDAESDRLLLRRLAESGASVQQPWRGSNGMLGDLRWSVLWPAPAAGAGQNSSSTSVRGGFEVGNDSSLVLEFRGVGDCLSGCLSSLFLGDLGREAQEAMMRASVLTPVDVVKVSHHGSADQSDRLYERVAGVIGLIGVGAENTYGHPTAELLSTLQSTGTLALRTDTDGMILLAPSTDPGAITVWTER